MSMIALLRAVKMARAEGECEEPLFASALQDLRLCKHGERFLSLAGITIGVTAGGGAKISAAGDERLRADAYQLLVDTYRNKCKPPELASLSGAALAALIQLKSSGFGEPIAAFVAKALGSWRAALPRVGSSDGAAGGDLTHRVRQANVALSLIGGYAEIVRPGASATHDASSSSSLGRVQVLRVNKQSELADVTRLPINGNFAQVGIDALTPSLKMGVETSDLEHLMPFLHWHLHSLVRSVGGGAVVGAGADDDDLGSDSDGDDLTLARTVSDSSAIARVLTSTKAGIDPDSGGGWNRARQSCLALRSLHTLLVSHPAETASVIAKDNQLIDQLTQVALSLGDEVIPDMSVSASIQFLEECVALLVDGLVKRERAVRSSASSLTPAAASDGDGGGVGGGEQIEDEFSKALTAGLSADEVGQLEQLAVNFASDLTSCVECYKRHSKNYAKTAEEIATAMLEGKPLTAPAAAKAPAKAKKNAQPAAAASPSSLQWILHEEKQHGADAAGSTMYARNYHHWARTLHAMGDARLAADPPEEANALECYKRAWTFYRKVEAPSVGGEKEELDASSVDAAAKQLKAKRKGLRGHWKPLAADTLAGPVGSSATQLLRFQDQHDGIRGVLKQVHPDHSIDELALKLVQSYIDRLLLDLNGHIEATTVDDVHTMTMTKCVERTLPGELAKHANSEGKRASKEKRMNFGLVFSLNITQENCKPSKDTPRQQKMAVN